MHTNLILQRVIFLVVDKKIEVILVLENLRSIISKLCNFQEIPIGQTSIVLKNNCVWESNFVKTKKKTLSNKPFFKTINQPYALLPKSYPKLRYNLYAQLHIVQCILKFCTQFLAHKCLVLLPFHSKPLKKLFSRLGVLNPRFTDP